MFSGRKVKWNHFGKKYSLRISDYEMDYADLFDAFMKKIHEVRPDFEGAIAYIDHYGRQSVVTNDKEFRDAINQSKGKLKLHTTLSDGQVLSAAEMVVRPRSYSVPPIVDRGYHSYPPTNSRSPSSNESAPPTYRNRVPSPPPAPIASQIKSQPQMLTHNRYEGYQKIPPAGYAYKYTMPYSQNLLYGMPPHSGMLLRFLASPFPFGHNHRSFIGPNKYHQFGAWGGSKFYSNSWGSVW